MDNNLLEEKKAVTQAFNAWCTYLSTNKLDNLVALYEPCAVLLPTLAEDMIKNQKDRRSYFTRLMQNPNLKVKIEESSVRLIDDLAINTGLYTFSFDKEGKRVEIPSRFTFIYKKNSKGWQIIDHHSSQIPQGFF